MTKSDAAALVAGLTEEERAALPSRLRALTVDDRTKAWQAAKATRDAALTAARDIEDPDARDEALTAARDAWATAKAELAEG